MASQSKRPQVVSPVNVKKPVGSTILHRRSEQDPRQPERVCQPSEHGLLGTASPWLAVCGARTPKPFVDSFIDGLNFWGNKIRVQYKTSNSDHMNFVVTLKTLLTRLALYIKIYHVTGVSWNPKGRGAVSHASLAVASVGDLEIADRTTKNMRKWFKRNKSDLTASVPTAPEPVATATDTPVPAAPAAAKKPAAPVKVAKPAVCEERNGNWQIEYQTGPEPLTVSGINMKQQVPSSSSTTPCPASRS
ncbi:unnamed protein product [Phytophthora lilii]|uniref:Unnamed protein product n=1 Tax=Phytophthora lilii TaxID=2077276 RepID=A0A9W7CSC9_9STRA|nr:unnamed protein product [Phytophthora lilii]